MKGIITFNVDVGTLPSDKVSAVINKKKEELKNEVQCLVANNYLVVFLENRKGDNSISKLDLN